jgi:hypothetical protein
MFDLSQNLGRRGRPDKGARGLVGFPQVGVDRFRERRHTVERPAPDPFPGNLPEPPLHQVQPGRAGWDEVQGEPGMSRQPLDDPGMFMRPVVVQNEVQRPSPRGRSIKLREEPDKLDMPVAVLTTPDDRSVQHVQRREERGRPVPNIVMRLPRRDPGPQRQHRRGPTPGFGFSRLHTRPAPSPAGSDTARRHRAASAQSPDHG